MTDRAAILAFVTHMSCCSWGMYFSAAASSENDHGSMNLASNTAPVGSITPSSVAAIHLTTGCLTCRWTSLMVLPEFRSYQSRFRGSVTDHPYSLGPLRP